MESKSQSNAYDLCGKCGHFRHLHYKNQSAFTTLETCHGHATCACTMFTEPNKKPVEINVEESVRDYAAYLKLISDKIESEVPHVRQIDRDYAEQVARNIVNVLDGNGFKIVRK